jgi:hypothetical protein
MGEDTLGSITESFRSEGGRKCRSSAVVATMERERRKENGEEERGDD